MIEELWTGLLELSGQFIVPDWGALVALVPIALAGLVFLYLTWTVYRFATAGPTTRGVHRVPPVTPPGIHMPGPSFAPVLAAFGTFMLLFGLFSGGIWLWIGVVVLVITLLYWGREAIRDYDHAVHPAGAVAQLPPGALPAPTDGTPPPGVHVPPPSFRPLLVSLGFTMLVGGMIAGGWAMLFGVIAMALVLLGWLRDSRREYNAVAEADRTGQLDMGGSPSWPWATFAALGVLLVAGIVLTSGVLSGSGGGAAVPSGGPVASGGSTGGGSGGGATPGPTLPAADASLTAENLKYLEVSITVPAGKPFKLTLDNRDQVPHNVEIRDGAGTLLFKGEIFSGPAVKVYDVPGLAAGQYTFACTVHPNMTGTVTAQ